MATKLLLADDSVTVQRVIELTFAEEDIEVISVGDGRQAIERADQELPDIVLADVSMPECDGYEVAAHIKQTPHLSHVPVVLMTGAFEQLDETRAGAAGCDAVLAKPFEPHMVIGLVRQLLRGEKVGAPASAPAARPSEPGPPGLPTLPPPPAGGLDAYLEQLDEALSAATGQAASRPAAGVPLGPDAATEPAARSAPSPSLADAFTVMLAEELGEAQAPAAWAGLASAAETGRMPPATAAPPISDALIDEIARRVSERLTDAAIREAVDRHVLEVTERLVRQEIERIKSEAEDA